MNFEFLQFVGGAALALVGVFVKERISSGTMQSKIKELEDSLKLEKDKNELQAVSIQNNREMILNLEQNHKHLDKKFDEFIKMHREEMKEFRITLSQSSQTMAKLDNSIQNLTGWLKRVDTKIDAKHS